MINKSKFLQKKKYIYHQDSINYRNMPIVKLVANISSKNIIEINYSEKKVLLIRMNSFMFVIYHTS